MVFVRISNFLVPFFLKSQLAVAKLVVEMVFVELVAVKLVAELVSVVVLVKENMWLDMVL